MNQYLTNLSLWLRGIRWLWTREIIRNEDEGGWVMKRPPYDGWPTHKPEGMIDYKPGWTPWRFLPIYLTTYLAGTLLGYGVVSLSRAWYDRSRWRCEVCGGIEGTFTSLHTGHQVIWVRDPLASSMTRLLDKLFPGSAHGRHTGPKLWGSVNLRD